MTRSPRARLPAMSPAGCLSGPQPTLCAACTGQAPRGPLHSPSTRPRDCGTAMPPKGDLLLSLSPSLESTHVL